MKILAPILKKEGNSFTFWENFKETNSEHLRHCKLMCENVPPHLRSLTSVATLNFVERFENGCLR